jgi:hypothetical protein
MIEIILLIACVLFILYFFYTLTKKEGFDDNSKENSDSNADSTDSDTKQNKEDELIALLTDFKNKYSDNIQSYVYDHTKKQDTIIMFYGQNNSTAQVSNVDGKLQIVIDYGNGNKETYEYLQVYDNQIVFVDSTNNKNSAVLQKTEKSMTLTVNSNENKYTFYPNISDSRNELATYINEYYYTDEKQGTQPTTNSSNSNSSNSKSNQDDLYILKSEIVPPVCPVCPTPITINECPKNSSGNTSTAGNTAGNTSTTGSTPEPSNPFVDSLNSAVKNLEAEYSQYQNAYQSAYQKQKASVNDVNQNSMLLPVQNYFANNPTLVTNGTSDSTNEPLPLLNSFSSFG